MTDPDAVAKQLFGGKATYESLSPWGKMAVHVAIGDDRIKDGGIQATTTHGPAYGARVERDVADLKRQVEKLAKDYATLWDENHDLKLEIEDLRRGE